jgi:hypothetical protein
MAADRQGGDVDDGALEAPESERERQATLRGSLQVI